MAGVLANPYRFVEPGQEFEHDAPMKWAEPVEGDPESGGVDEPSAGDEPEAGRPTGRRKRTAPAQPGGSEPDPI